MDYLLAGIGTPILTGKQAYHSQTQLLGLSCLGLSCLNVECPNGVLESLRLMVAPEQHHGTELPLPHSVVPSVVGSLFTNLGCRHLEI